MPLSRCHECISGRITACKMDASRSDRHLLQYCTWLQFRFTFVFNDLSRELAGIIYNHTWNIRTAISYEQILTTSCTRSGTNTIRQDGTISNALENMQIPVFPPIHFQHGCNPELGIFSGEPGRKTSSNAGEIPELRLLQPRVSGIRKCPAFGVVP